MPSTEYVTSNNASDIANVTKQSLNDSERNDQQYFSLDIM